ncbi:cystathionine gamma-synthase [Ktedonobacter sp. SOSP1-52]|uniref:trans-sulfuration enzyme family protein n=1 Tax=Ktedonobacter sp. SOSP1-52 TaxID=2778366 RepID=UPI001915EF38|nr:PLP-dependent aspartate aminotransferase family protein [Ktedonobacter sp. SOSP1-52]GHO65656.1 cystathionine gamma-synthase [Ktedonobacter sp. SOSP1-52]
MTDYNTNWHLDTQLIHEDRRARSRYQTGTPTVQPIHASTTYIHESCEALDRAFSGKTPDGDAAFVYARQGNPNAQTLEDALARAERGVGAITFGSGMAAINAALITAGLTSGTKILASKDLYGPSIGLLQAHYIPNGVEVVLKDLCVPEVGAIIREEQPDVVYLETISNPLVKIADLDAISAAAQEVGAITVIDSTFATPYLIRPLEHGFDLVVHSTTKYISGHGDSTGGAVISSKNSLMGNLRTNANLLGAMLSPFEAHLTMRGLRTLALRMERHCGNANQVAAFLSEHPAVECVHFPSLASHPQHALAERLIGQGRYGGLLSFELKEQSQEAVYRFMNRLQLCLPATSLGDVFSLVSYPPMSSHRTLGDKERRNLGINPGCIRLSVGIEHIDDILSDLDQALRG